MPFPDQLTLPPNVKAALLEHLLIPFETEAEAKDYWQENAVQLVIGEIPTDAVAEYSDQLPGGYTISLVIANNDSGCYYVTQEKP